MKRKHLRFITCCFVLGVLVVASTIFNTGCGPTAASTFVATSASNTKSNSVTTAHTNPTTMASSNVSGVRVNGYYKNSKYTIAAVPTGWTVDSTNVNDITLNSPDDPNIYVRVICAVNPVTSLDSYLSTCVALFKLEYPDYAEQSRSQVTLSHLPAYFLQVTFTKNGVPLKGIMYAVVNGTQGICEVGIAKAADWDKNSSNLDYILESIGLPAVNP